MKRISLFVRMTIALSLSSIVWLVLFFGFNQLFWFSSALALSGGVLFFVTLQSYAYYTFLKKHQLSRNEYVYIRKNLREAKAKIKRIRKTFLGVRSIRMFRQTVTMNRLAKRIYSIVTKEPKRFYQAERFFFYHLDSMVELTEKYAFLAAQPLTDPKIKHSLRQTQDTIDQLIASVGKDLDILLATDVDQLRFELDVAQHSLHKWNQPLQERRSNNE